MEQRPTRSIRVPADNCPECLGEQTDILEMRAYSRLTYPMYGPNGSMTVAYGCACGNTWQTHWAVEFVA